MGPRHRSGARTRPVWALSWLRALLVVAAGALVLAACGGGSDTLGKGTGKAPAEPELTGGRLDGSYEVTWEMTSFRFKGEGSGGLFGPDSSGSEEWSIRCGDSTCSFQSDDLGEGSLAGLLIEAFEIEELEVGSESVSQGGRIVDRCGKDVPGAPRLKKVVTTARLDLRGSDPQMVNGVAVFTHLSGTVTVDPSKLQVKKSSPLGFVLSCEYPRFETRVSGTRVG